jgi:undecaprenyl-diphosphatase
MNLDWMLFAALNARAGRSAVLDAIGIGLAEDALALFGVLLVALWVWPGTIDQRRTRQRYVLNAALALGGALLTAHFLGVFFYRARPFVDHAVTLLIAHPPDASFPSDHLAVAGALIVALWPILGRTRWVWIGLSGTIGLARLFVGVHYPTDILGGFVLGAAWGLLALRLAPRAAASERRLLTFLARWRLA